MRVSTYKRMILGPLSLILLTASVSGCGVISSPAFNGKTTNEDQTCNYGYFLVPALSVSRWMEPCGPMTTEQQR